MRPAVRRYLGVVAKRPANGHTKTRLCPPLDGDTAAELYEAFLRDTLALMRQTPNVERAIAFLPDDAEPYFRQLAPDFNLTPQQGDDLGARLDNLLAVALAQGAGQAVVIDSDSPTLPAHYIDEAFAALDRGADLVLGPTADGGYYLIGLARPQPRLLRDIPLSTATVLQDTLALARALGLKTALLSPWYDIDTAADLDRLRYHLAELPADIAPHTRRRLADLPAVNAHPSPSITDYRPLPPGPAHFPSPPAH